MAKQVIWSKRAFNDRRAILEYWIERNQSMTYSKLLNQIFENTTELISKFPKLGKKTVLQDIRIKIVKDYFITYRETKTKVEILTIWDYRQDPVDFVRILRK
jgi:toxin YoeB